jgi:hypothetical protein
MNVKERAQIYLRLLMSSAFAFVHYFNLQLILFYIAYLSFAS